MKYIPRLIVYNSSVLDRIFCAHFTGDIQEGETQRPVWYEIRRRAAVLL